MVKREVAIQGIPGRKIRVSLEVEKVVTNEDGSVVLMEPTAWENQTPIAFRTVAVITFNTLPQGDAQLTG